MRKIPWSAAAAQLLIILNALFWLGFAVVAALGLLPGSLSTGLFRWVMAALSLGASLVLGILVFCLIRRVKWAYTITVILLILLAVLSITDEVGVLDLFSLMISLAGFILLLINRDWYLDLISPDQGD